MTFFKSLRESIKNNARMQEPINKEIYKRLESPVQEHLFRHLRETLAQGGPSRSQSVPTTRRNSAVRIESKAEVSPAMNSVELQRAMNTITKIEKLRAPQNSPKKERNSSNSVIQFNWHCYKTIYRMSYLAS